MEIIVGFIHAVIAAILITVVAAVICAVIGLAIIGGLWIWIIRDWR